MLEQNNMFPPPLTHVFHHGMMALYISTLNYFFMAKSKGANLQQNNLIFSLLKANIIRSHNVWKYTWINELSCSLLCHSDLYGTVCLYATLIYNLSLHVVPGPMYTSLTLSFLASEMHSSFWTEGEGEILHNYMRVNLVWALLFCFIYSAHMQILRHLGYMFTCLVS